MADQKVGAQRGKIKGKAEVKDKDGNVKVAPPSHPMKPDNAAEATLTPYEAGALAASHGYSVDVRLKQVASESVEEREWLRGYHDTAHPHSTGRVEDIEGGYRGSY